MSLAEWISRFRAMHERAKEGRLSPEERGGYHSAREELARAFVAAQRVQTRPDQKARQAIRVSRALQADLDLPSEKEMIRATTLDLSVGGFGALLAKAPPPNEKARFTLRLPGGERLQGEARVVGTQQGLGSARVAFRFEGLGGDAIERIELLVFDTVLEQLDLKK
jgi:c-di-GMP-binding flagellar brake protein YcgR